MPNLPNLQQLREKIRSQIALENVVKQSDGNTQLLYNALAIVPENQMLYLVQWLHETLLPKIAETRGVDSLEYKNHVAVRDAVIFALYIGDSYERLLLQIGNDKFMLNATREKMLFYENELLKYRSMEQLIADETIKDYRATVVQRALQIIEHEKDKPNV